MSEEQSENVETEIQDEVKAENLLYGDSEEASAEGEPGSEAESKDTKSSEESESDEVAKDGDEKDDQGSDKESESESKEVVYDLALGEKTFLTEESVEKTIEFAKQNNLSNDAAKEILTRQDLAIADFVTKQEQLRVKETNDWAEQVKSDPELGGDNLTMTIENSKSVLDRFGSEELTEMLRESGSGNNPTVVKFLAKIGAAMAEDKFITSSRHGDPVAKPVEDLFYGSNN